MTQPEQAAVETCERTIVEKGWPGHTSRKCGKKASCKMPDGLPVCGEHYKKWVKKMQKRTARDGKRRM